MAVMNYPPPAQAPAQAPLPDGFIAQWNQQYQRNFYVNTKTGQSQWEDPRTQFALPMNPPPGAPSDKGIGAQAPPPYPGQAGPNYQYQSPSYQNQSQPQQYGQPPQQYQQYPAQQQPQQQSTLANAMHNPMATGFAGAAAGLLGGVLLGEGIANMENRHHHHQQASFIPQPQFQQQPQVIEEIVYVNNNPDICCINGDCEECTELDDILQQYQERVNHMLSSSIEFQRRLNILEMENQVQKSKETHLVSLIDALKSKVEKK
ncbi:hypothetical protein HDV06_005801 [Boothiomyces sp. JEL0866]|nr:hypothetical protein HDV06_005801 [Boothiomyces sp. JEL0866]